MKSLTLTPRETEVVKLYATGSESKNIAHQLGIARVTVDAILGTACKRIGIYSRVNLVRWAIRTGLVEA